VFVYFFLFLSLTMDHVSEIHDDDDDDDIYISCLCYDVSVRLSVRLSVTGVHWHIIANLGSKFRSQFTAHCGHSSCGREGRDHRREEWRDHLALC